MFIIAADGSSLKRFNIGSGDTNINPNLGMQAAYLNEMPALFFNYYNQPTYVACASPATLYYLQTLNPGTSVYIIYGLLQISPTIVMLSLLSTAASGFVTLVFVDFTSVNSPIYLQEM